MSIRWYSKQNLKNKLSLILLLTILLVVGILGIYFEYFLRSNYAARAQQQINFVFHRIYQSFNSVETDLKKGIAFIQDDEIMISSLELINTYEDKNHYNAILLDEEKKNIATQLLYHVKLSLNDSIALYNAHQELIAYVYKTDQGYRLNFISYENNKVTLYSRLEREGGYTPISTQFLRLIPYRHRNSDLSSKGFVSYHTEKNKLIINAHMSLIDKKTNHLSAHIEMSHTIGDSYFKTLSNNLNMLIYSCSNPGLKTVSVPLDNKNRSIPIINGTKNYKGCASIVTKEGPFYIVADLDKTFQAESLEKNRVIFFSIIVMLTLIAIAFLRLLFNRQIANPLQGLMDQIQIIKRQDDDSDFIIKTGDELEVISKSMHQLSKTVHERENMLTHLLELSPIAVRIAKKQGNKVVFANRAYGELIHAEISTVLEKNPQNYYLHHNVYDEIVYQISNNEVIRDRLVELFINNQTVWALASYTLIEFEGEPCVLGWFYNITEQKERERELAHEKHFISTIVESANSIIAVIDAKGIMTKINHYGENFTEYSQEEISSEPYFWKRFVPLEMQDQVMDIIVNTNQGNLIKSFRNSWISKSGNERVFEWSNTLVQQEDGSMDYLVIIGLDITEQANQEALIQLQKEEFETMFHISKDAIAILDQESNFLDFNDAYLEMTGFTREELLATSCIALSAPEDVARSIEALNTVFEKGSIKNYEKTCIVKNNKRIIINMSVSLMPDKQRILISVKDVTESKNHERQLEHIAHYDPLTGLPNRVLNADRLRQAILQAGRRNEQVAVLYLDLDGFKEVNDRYGHSIGDKLLIALALEMKQTLREGDTISRLGGDEFVTILPDLDERSMALPIIQRLLDTASKAIQIDDIIVQVSASIGATFYPQYENVDADQLIRQADQAMYNAKQSGKNRYHIFDPEHDRILREKHESVERIEQALRNNELVLHYQPKINMRTGNLVGVEALIRWQHPTNGLIPPPEFLPYIEDHPLAIDIGEWVINEAMSQIRKWKETGLDTHVSVNVGARQLLKGDFYHRLQWIMTQHDNFDPSSLTIEILETSALENIDQAAKIIEECKTIGIYFALDDFGTGYSSLTYLKRLPVSTIKIDQSFVRNMLVDRDDLAILAGIVGLASAFDKEVIAEGVETFEHGQQLLSLGCDLAQGYGIARPMPAENLIAWSKRWKQNHKWIV